MAPECEIDENSDVHCYSVFDILQVKTCPTTPTMATQQLMMCFQETTEIQLNKLSA